MEIERIAIDQSQKPDNVPSDGSGGINALKAIAEQSSMLSNLAMSNIISNNNRSQQNTVQNQNSINQIFISTTAKSVNTVSSLEPVEARCAVDITTNDEVSQLIADLSAVLKQNNPNDK